MEQLTQCTMRVLDDEADNSVFSQTPGSISRAKAGRSAMILVLGLARPTRNHRQYVENRDLYETIDKRRRLAWRSS